MRKHFQNVSERVILIVKTFFDFRQKAKLREAAETLELEREEAKNRALKAKFQEVQAELKAMKKIVNEFWFKRSK